MEPVGESTSSEFLQPTLEKSEVTKLATLFFDHIEGQIKAVDSKACFTSSAGGILITLFTGLSKELFEDLGKGFGSVLTLLMFGLISGSIFYALMVVKPTLTAPASQNLFYFGDIQKLREDEFTSRFQSQHSDEISASLLAQVYIKAKIANRKFTALNGSLYFFFAALGLWAVKNF